MELIETLRNIAICEGFAAGRSLRELSDEISVFEVLQREVDLHLHDGAAGSAAATQITTDEAVVRLSQGPH